MTTLDPRQSVEFEPVALGRRLRRVDPLAVVVLVIVGGLALSVAKPWADPDRDRSAGGAAEPGPSTAPAAPAAVAHVVPPVPASAIVAVPQVRWADLAPVVQPHAGWGVRVIVPAASLTATGGRDRYQERWVGIGVTGTTRPNIVVLSGARSAVALGLTFPPGRVPLDVRISTRTARGTWRWLDARPVGRSPDEGGLIFTPPAAGLGSSTWSAGEYRIDALLDGATIQRFEVDIPDRYENVRPSTAEVWPSNELVSADQVDFSSLPQGPFAAIDRVGLPLESAAGPPLDEATAWLDTDAGSSQAPQRDVAIAYLPRAAGLGVRLPDGSTLRSAVLTRLAPDPFPSGPVLVGGGIIVGRYATPWVLFPAYWGEAVEPGVYRIDATWSDADGPHRASWHIELRAGPVRG